MLVAEEEFTGDFTGDFTVGFTDVLSLCAIMSGDGPPVVGLRVVVRVVVVVRVGVGVGWI